MGVLPPKTMARVLIIDDDDMVRRLLQEHLSNEGYDVVAAPMAEEGYLMALADPPDLILLDVNLPDATGFQMCGRFRQNPVTKSIPIIMMTGAARWPNQQGFGKLMGADAYVLKPFNVIEMGDRVDALMGAKKPVREAPVPETAAPIPAPALEESPPPAPPKEPESPPPLLLLMGPAEAPKPVVPEKAPPAIELPAPAAHADDPQAGEDQRFSDFSVEVVILVSRLPRTRAGRHIADQLIKCGTLVGARINESLLAESTEDDLRFRRAALKDLREAAYWLMLIRKSELLAAPSLKDLETQCQKLSAELMPQIARPKQNA